MAESPRPEEQQRPAPPHANGAGRLIGAVFGIAFAGIGLTVIVSLWAGGMGDPPVFFKLVGSFMGLIFVAVGGTARADSRRFCAALLEGPRTLGAPVARRCRAGPGRRR
jgi:hypothetical protein